MTSTTTNNGQGQGRGPGRGRGRGRGPGRGRGRGRGSTAGRSNAGRGNTSTTTSHRPVNPYPGIVVSESVRAFTDGWEIIHDGKCDFSAENTRGAYSIDDFEDVLNAQLSTRLKACLHYQARQIVKELSTRMLPTNRLEIFKFLACDLVREVQDYTTQALVSDKLLPTNETEMWLFVGTYLMGLTYHVSPDMTFKILEDLARAGNYVSLNKQRFHEIETHLKGRALDASAGQWGQQTRNLNSLNELNERALLKVRNTLMDPENSVLVLDDELFGSRASDVETKTVSDRKAGKEGPVHDIVADSLLGTPYAISLRVKGVTVTDNSHTSEKTS
jgi:hypothetical protein